MIDRLFTRNNVVWTITFVASILAFVAANTRLIPAPYSNTVKDLAMVLGFIGAKLGVSPLPSSQELDERSL